MAHGGELVAKMEWLLQEVDKKNDELMRKTSEVDHLRQEAARLLSATGQDGSSGHLAVQVQVRLYFGWRRTHVATCPHEAWPIARKRNASLLRNGKAGRRKRDL